MENMCFRSRTRPTVGLLVAFLAPSIAPVHAYEVPVDPPATIETLIVTKSAGPGDIFLSWSDGTATFVVVRSETPNFQTSTTITYLTTSTPLSTFTDAGVLNDGKDYFYQVYDVFVPPTIFSIAPPAPMGVGDTVTIQGVGFGACPDIQVLFEGGGSPSLLACSSTQIQIEIPATVIAGDVVVVSPTGIADSVTRLDAIGMNGTAFSAIKHIGVDAAHNLYVCDVGSNNTVWKIDFATGTKSAFSNLNFPIVGIPFDIAGNLYVANATFSDFNKGEIFQIDPAAGKTSWANAGTASSDPSTPRALARDPSGLNPDLVFVHDPSGSGADKIRKIAQGAGPGTDKNWLVTPLGVKNDPAGLAFNAAGEFFFTAGSNIRHYDSTRTQIQNFSISDGLNRPGQLALDDDQHLWVANRNGNNVLRIRTDPLNREVRLKIDGITSPRGIAFDRDPGSNRPYVYVADVGAVYRFRVYDTVFVDIKVLVEALTSPQSGTVTSEAAFVERVQRDFKRARDILRQCDINLVLRGIQFIADPNGANGTIESNIAPPNGAGCGAGLTAQEITLLGTSRYPTSETTINVYYINHYQTPDPTIPGAWIPADMSGAAYTNDCFAGMVNRTEGGVFMSRFGSPDGGTTFRGTAIDTTLAHELMHFLLDTYANPVGPGEHRGVGGACAGAGGDEFYIMYGTGRLTRWTIDAPECTNMLTNSDESEFIERF